MQLPEFDDVVQARQFIAPYLPPTPLVHSWPLSQLMGCEYHLKCENFQPVGAFKVRGGVNLVGNLEAAAKSAGVISASTGNHGQSIAFAGRIFEVPVIIYGPEYNANPLKIQVMRELGAEVRLHGRDFDEARIEVERVAQQEGYRYVHSANESKLIAGVGTMGLEIFDILPQVDVIVVPVGAGSGACGNALVARQLKPEVEVIGVQSAAAPACWTAWKERRLDVEAETQTRQEGLATRMPFEMTLRLMWDLLDDFILVADEEIDAAVRLLARHAHIVAEGAGAAALAGAMKLRQRLQGKNVVGIVSGGNIPLQDYAELLSTGE